jgi:hypothetical protein
VKLDDSEKASAVDGIKVCCKMMISWHSCIWRNGFSV